MMIKAENVGYLDGKYRVKTLKQLPHKQVEVQALEDILPVSWNKPIHDYRTNKDYTEILEGTTFVTLSTLIWANPRSDFAVRKKKQQI